MRAARLLIWLALQGWCVASLSARDVREEAVCGPRCAQQILEHYGQQVDLIQLIKEMQDGIVDQPSSVRDIQESLEKRGVYTKPVKIGLLTFPDWRQPIVLHYQRGHFVVLDETKGSYAKIRDGAAMEPVWSFIPWVMLSQSGVALLTSDTPIQGDLPVILWPRMVVALSGIGLGTAGFLIRRRSMVKCSIGFSKYGKENVT